VIGNVIGKATFSLNEGGRALHVYSIAIKKKNQKLLSFVHHTTVYKYRIQSPDPEEERSFFLYLFIK